MSDLVSESSKNLKNDVLNRDALLWTSRASILSRNSVFRAGCKKTFIDYCQLFEECPDWEDNLCWFLSNGSIPPWCLPCKGVLLKDSRAC